MSGEVSIEAITLIAYALIATGLVQGACIIGIYYRHAIPRAPWFFRLLTVPPGIVLSLSSMLLGGMFAVGGEEVFGVEVLVIVAVRVISEFLTWGSLLAYAGYWYWKKT